MPKIILIVAVVLAMGCGRSASDSAVASRNPPAESGEAPAQADRQVYQVRGVVQEVKADEKKIVIKHEEIPNYMPAMTMPFPVKNMDELAGLAPMDQVSFTMIVTDDDGWIENIRKTGVDGPVPGERPHTRIAREVEPLSIGDKMPNYTFTNSLGEKISLSDFEGSAYAFTFIFTRCPFPTFCPRMNMNFAQAYERLKEMANGPTNWHLVSISFDPDYDTPARLKEYSAMYKPDPKKWHWVTGGMTEIDAITEQVGLAFAFAETGIFNHTLRTVVVDKDGRIRQNLRGNEWTADELVSEIVKGAKGEPIEKNEEL